MHYKVGQMVLQSRASITKWDNYYKVARYRRQMRKTEEGNIFWQQTPRFTTDLPGDREFAPINF